MKNLVSVVMAAGLLLGVCAGAVQANGHWEVIHQEAGITLEKRMLPGKPYRQLRGSMVMPGSMAALLKILENPAHCPQWMNNCRQSRTVKQISPAERIDYTVVDAPLFLEDRDMYIHSKASYDSQSQAVTVTMRGVEDFAGLHPGRVRVLDLQGQWRFQQLNDQQVKVDYLMYNNPQVKPASAVNSSKPTAVFRTFKQLRALAGSARFRNVTIPAVRLQAIKIR